MAAITRRGCDDEIEEMSRLGVEGIKKSRILSCENNLVRSHMT